MRVRIFSFFRRVRRRRRPVGTAEYLARKEEARAFVHARLTHWQTVHPFGHGQVRIKNHRRAWGSCSLKKNLNFNWRLITLPQELADYVVLHELCHTVHFNHSADFWNLLTSLSPDAPAHRAQLRQVRLV